MNNNLSQITHYGVSETLQGLFSSLREMQGRSGNKFRGQDIDKLSQLLVCRNYGKACLELAYLLWAVVNYAKSNSADPDPLLNCFWIDEVITPARVRDYFKVPFCTNDSSISVGSDYLDLILNNHKFSISPTRIGTLAALLEFVVYINPNILSRAQQTLLDADLNSIKQSSSALQKMIYDFLSDHLQPAQQQRRFRYIIQWLQSQDKTDRWLDDDTVLQFWLQASDDQQSLGFKLYANVLIDLMTTDQALTTVNYQLQSHHALSIGYDAEAGEMSPDQLSATLVDCVEDEPDLSWLYGAPKFLAKNQFAFMKPLIDAGKYVEPLLHSLMRSKVMGSWQSTLVQVSRSKNTDLMQQKIQQDPDYGYQQYLVDIYKATVAIKDTLQCLLHIFTENNLPQAMSLMLMLTEKTNQQHIRDMFADVLSEEDAMNYIGYHLKQLSGRSRGIEDLLHQGTVCFAANNRIGFKTLPSKETLDAYLEADGSLQRLLPTFQNFYQGILQLYGRSGGEKELFVSDTSIFKDKFTQLHGTQ